MVSDSRKAAKQGIDSTSRMLKSLKSQINIIADIRDFIKDFREQKITIQRLSSRCTQFVLHERRNNGRIWGCNDFLKNTPSYRCRLG